MSRGVFEYLHGIFYISYVKQVKQTNMKYHQHLDQWAIHFKFSVTWSCVSLRYRKTQLQVTGNLCYLWNLGPNIYQYFKIERIFYCEQLVIIGGYTGASKNTECLVL